MNENIEDVKSFSSCKLKDLSTKPNSILLGTKYFKSIEIDPKFFNCCLGKEVIFNDIGGIRSCGISERFSRLKKLFKEFSLYWNTEIDVLYKKAFSINSLYFLKEKKDFFDNKKQAIYMDKKYIDSFLKQVRSFENKETIDNLDFSYIPLYIGIFFLWRLDAFIHFIRLGSKFKEYLDFSKLCWSSTKEKKNVFIVSIDEKYRIEDLLVLERVINFCYNYNIYLIIIESFDISKNTESINESNIQKEKSNPLRRKSFFTKKISSLKEKSLILSIDENARSKLSEMLCSME